MNLPASESPVFNSVNARGATCFEDGATLLKRLLEKRRHDWTGRGKYQEPSTPEVSQLPALPKSWVWVSPEQLASGLAYSLAIGPFGSNLKVSDYTTSGVPLVFVRNIRAARFGGEGSVFVSESKAADLKAHQISAGDLLITKMGDPPGDACIYPHFGQDAVITADCIKLRLSPLLDSPQFFVHAINSHAVRSQILNITKGVAQLKVSLGRFATIGIPLPPLQEQRQIVAKIETQSTRLEAGVTALRQAQTKLKRYRAAVLKAACEGRLVPTEAELAREEGHSYEPASELLARILAERRQRWQGRGKYQPPVLPDMNKMPLLPEGWQFGSLEQLTNANRPICYGILMPKENVPVGILYVKVRDMKGDRIDLTSLHRTTKEIASKYARASLQAGDVLLSIRGTFGRVAETPAELDGGNITQDTARLDVTSQIDHRYIATCLRSPDCQNYFKRVARGVAVKGVNISEVKTTPIALPPLAEQTRIVAEVEQRISVVHELEAVVAANLKRAIRLRQSILQKAFTGKLVK